MDLLNYIFGASTAWFIGFFPLFEIYIAVPAGIAAGLPWFDAFLWATLGNWMVIPFIDLCYDWLMRFDFMKNLNEKSLSKKWEGRIESHGAWLIIFLTPLAGVWAIGLIAKALKYKRIELWLYTGISISVTGLIIAILTNMGIQFVS